MGEKQATCKGSDGVIVYTLLGSHFFIVALSIKINFSVRTQVLVKSVPVRHVTYGKKKIESIWPQIMWNLWILFYRQKKSFGKKWKHNNALENSIKCFLIIFDTD